jgi:signal peptidase II
VPVEFPATSIAGPVDQKPIEPVPVRATIRPEYVRATMRTAPLLQTLSDHLDPHRTPLPWRMIFAQMLAIGSGILALDQGSKFLMAEWLGPGASQHRVDVIGSWVGFEYVENTGAAFGMLSGRPWLVSILAVVVAVMFVTVFRQVLPTDAGVRWCVALILAGAIGNMIDRARIGYVVDFVAVGAWPRFNIADSSITVGLVLMIVSAFGIAHEKDDPA